MSRDKAAVQTVLDKVRNDGRNSLTAPECKTVCEAYGIPTPKEGLATTAAEVFSPSIARALASATDMRISRSRSLT